MLVRTGIASSVPAPLKRKKTIIIKVTLVNW